MPYVIASWNVEKNGQSSTDIKQAKVIDFIDGCVKMDVDVIFLCEVHSSRLDDYVAYLTSVYDAEYHVVGLPGGHSNGYIIMTRKARTIEISGDTLKGLNRGIQLLKLDNDLVLCLAHFKSGQTGLTKDQIQNAAIFLDNAMPARWAITGDMNWDYARVGELVVPGGSHAGTCWADQTQAKGGILDWCLTGGATEIAPVDVANLFPPETNDMSGPDHRPVLFVIGPS